MCDFHLDFNVELQEPFPKRIQVKQSLTKYETSIFFLSALGHFQIKPTRHWPIIDGQFEENLFCVCPPSPAHPVLISPCEGLQTYNVMLWEMEIWNTYWNDCTYTGYPAKCCYSIKVTNEEYYEVYTGFSISFQNLDLGYNGKTYQLYFGNTTQLNDLNVSLLGLTNHFYPFEDVALLVDINGNIKVAPSNLINTAEGRDINKLGWWKQNPDITKVGFTALPSEIAPDKNQFTSKFQPLKFNQAASLPFGLDIRPTFKKIPGIQIMIANIIIHSEDFTVYKYQSQDVVAQNFTVDVNGMPQRVCVRYPSICVCNDNMFCLNIGGKIKILLESNQIGTALLDGRGNLLSDVSSNLEKIRYQYQPPKVRLNVKSNTFIPPIMLNSAAPYKYTLYNDSKVGFYCIFELNQYPSRIILQDGQASLYVSLKQSNTSIFVNWKETDKHLLIYDQNGKHSIKPFKVIQQYWNFTNSTKSALNYFLNIWVFSFLYFILISNYKYLL